MTKAELIKALDGIPDATPLYVWVQSTHDIYGIDMDVIDREDGSIHEVHLNVYDGTNEHEQEMQELNAHLGRI